MYIRKGLFISKLALVSVLGYMVVRTMLMPEYIETTLAPASALGRDEVRVDEATNPPDLSLADYAEIVERNPFGTSGQTTGSSKWAPMSDVNGLGQSVSEELGVELFGTVSGDPVLARAIIKDLKTGVFDLYKMGQTVGDARIESIDTDAVILAHNGERKILRLNTAQSGSYNDINTQALSSQTVNRSDDVRTDLSTQEAGHDVRKEIACVEAILSKADIKPHAVSDQIEGLRITGLENIREAKVLGLQNGDIIRAVNGHRLTNKQKTYQIFKKARSQAAINLDLLRDNKSKKLSFANEIAW